MRIVARRAGVALAVVLSSTVLVLGAAACGGSGTQSAHVALPSASPHWERLLSTHVSGDKPVRLFLGAHPLGERLRLAWVLSGPSDPPVTLTARIINVANGVGYGHSVVGGPQAPALQPLDDQAIELSEPAGTYRVYFSQRFRAAKGPGYDIELTVYTLR